MESTPSESTPSPATVRIWDLPTRLFHWSLVLCVTGLFATAYVPGASVEIHARFGFAVLTLLLFRIVWGFIGGHWSRFASFARRGDPLLGHSRLGTLSIVAMLLALALQVATGLISDDEISFTGPFNHLVSAATGLSATRWHKNLGQWLLIGLLALHLAAIAYYLRVRKINLVPSMLRGDKPLPGDLSAQDVPASRDTAGTRLLGLLVLVLCAALVLALLRQLGTP